MQITKKKIPLLITLSLCFIASLVSFFCVQTNVFAATLGGGSNHQPILSDSSNAYSFVEGSEVVSSFDDYPQYNKLESFYECSNIEHLIDNCNCSETSLFGLKYNFALGDEKYGSLSTMNANRLMFKHTSPAQGSAFLEWKFYINQLAPVGSSFTKQYTYVIRLEYADTTGDNFVVHYLKKDYDSNDSLYLRDDSFIRLNYFAENGFPGVRETTGFSPAPGLEGCPIIKSFVISSSIADSFGSLIKNIYLLGFQGSGEIFSDYFIGFDFNQRYFYREGLFNTVYANTRKHCSLKSSASSLGEKLSSLVESDSEWINLLPDEYKSYARRIVSSIPKTTIYLDYLKAIDGTPFAVKTRASAEISLLEDEILSYADLYRIFNVDSFKIFNSYEENIIQNEKLSGHYYEVIYNRDIRIRTVDSSGLESDFYLSMEKSFDEYYSSFNELVDSNGAEIITDDMKSKFFNDIMIKYSNVATEADYSMANHPDIGFKRSDYVYGYWGLIVIPVERTLNELYSYYTSLNTNTVGLSENYSRFNLEVSLDCYNYLLKERGFNFLGVFPQIFSQVISGKNARCNCYMFYGESGIDGFIGENGGDPNDEDQKSSISSGIIDFFEKVSTETEKNPLGVFLGVAGFLCLIVLLIYIFNKLKPLFNVANKVKQFDDNYNSNYKKPKNKNHNRKY